ncbi:carboxypeptidase-like regulatory domain-containing protein [Mucilaginibacter sp.]|uniref:carboxypeptidase-like regulatory domain-containing protein n=1 Tax=Mucilaginibacter sp. TaxID=1882438 RepID=UPI0032679A87
MKYHLLLLFLLPLAGFAQIKITGNVVNAADGKPVANASVFLSNATVGSKTTDDGAFVLNYVKPGQYEFVVSVVGFETYRQIVMAGNENISLPGIKLSPKTTSLKEVKIVASSDWESNYAKFKQEFLGTSVAAEDCKITNNDALTLEYDKETHRLTGSSTDFLEIENKYLGYKIKYILKTFSKDENTGMLYFDGAALFAAMDGSLSQKRRWQKRRKQTYEGSSMHFFRSLLQDTTELEGFTVHSMIRKPNPLWIGESAFASKYIQTFGKNKLKAVDLLQRTDRDGLYAIAFGDFLHIKHSSAQRGSVMSINGPYAYFDTNGIIVNPAMVIFEGVWGRNRMAELLPVDYEPVVAADR